MNAPLEKIPEHLNQYITEQKPSLYTAIDHATWRYVMRVSRFFFKETAHPLYLKGLELTGIPTERIPLVAEMDLALRKFGWRAVAINGFIPPATFLEFQSLRILAIACDIRKLENLGYTPSPDIIHEAAGHAPIVADPHYRRYLEAYGAAARNAIINLSDLELYQAIFELSEIKEDPHSSSDEIELAQQKFEQAAAQEGEPSEAALLTRMAWWTNEYGLIGTLDRPAIYGAGLLSSVDESYKCLSSTVKKVPFSLEAVIHTPYDITRPQPQLFVAESFDQLTEALETFSNTMAYKVGGVAGLKLAKKAKNTVTVVLDQGVQFTGIVSDYELTDQGQESAFTLTGAKQIAYENKTHPDVSHHHFGNSIFIPFMDKVVSTADLGDLQRKLHGSGLVSKGGLRITGRFKKEVLLGGRVRVLILEKVKIFRPNQQCVYEERVRDYPLVLASSVVSVFGGAADRAEFAMRGGAKGGSQPRLVKSHKSNLTEENRALNELYASVRDFREQKRTQLDQLDVELKELHDFYPEDWLLRLEFFELYKKFAPDSLATARLKKNLIELQQQFPALNDLIERGIQVIE